MVELKVGLKNHWSWPWLGLSFHLTFQCRSESRQGSDYARHFSNWYDIISRQHQLPATSQLPYHTKTLLHYFLSRACVLAHIHTYIRERDLDGDGRDHGNTYFIHILYSFEWHITLPPQDHDARHMQKSKSILLMEAVTKWVWLKLVRTIKSLNHFPFT